MKRIIIYLVLTTYVIFASELKNNQTKDTKFIDSISFGLGKNKFKHNIFKLGLQREFSSNIYENELGHLSGFYDLSFNQWNYSDSSIYGLAFSPVFEYYFNTNIKGFTPFIHIGIGATYITKTLTHNSNFTTHFQFEDRVGIGILSKKYKLNFDYFHYSNGSIKKPNDGMDMILISYIYLF